MRTLVDRHAPGKNYIELLAVLDRVVHVVLPSVRPGVEMCGECPLPELYIIFVLDDSVDFDGFVVPDRMEALLSSALENHRIRSTREHLSTARRFISAWPAT